jgi:hypothetical protein
MKSSGFFLGERTICYSAKKHCLSCSMITDVFTTSFFLPKAAPAAFFNEKERTSK